MLGGVKLAGGADWSVLIMDVVTTKVMSKAARISEILDYGVSRESASASPASNAVCIHDAG